MQHKLNHHWPTSRESSTSEFRRDRATLKLTRYSHILVPATLTDRDRPALMLGLQLAGSLDARLTLLHVLPSEEAANSMHWLDAIGGLHQAMSHNENSTSARPRSLQRARSMLLAYIEQEIPPTVRSLVDIQAECRQGNHEDEIVKFAEHAGVDLVILSNSLSRWLPIMPLRVHRLLQQLRKHLIILRSDDNGSSPGKHAERNGNGHAI